MPELRCHKNPCRLRGYRTMGIKVDTVELEEILEVGCDVHSLLYTVIQEMCRCDKLQTCSHLPHASLYCTGLF